LQTHTLSQRTADLRQQHRLRAQHPVNSLRYEPAAGFVQTGRNIPRKFINFTAQFKRKFTVLHKCIPCFLVNYKDCTYAFLFEKTYSVFSIKKTDSTWIRPNKHGTRKLDREPPIFRGKSSRLYCYRLSERVVFLFDGDVKTADAAQDCPQVRPHFRMANQLARAINEAFKQQDIEWNDDCSDIIYDEDFLLIF